MNAGLERLIITGITALAVGLAAAGESPTQRELLEHDTRSQSNLIPDPEIPVPAAQAPPAPARAVEPAPVPWLADEARLWRLLEAGRLDALERGIGETADRHPDWQPPAELVRLLAQARGRQALANADGEALIALSVVMPERFSCAEIGNLWRLAEAYRAAGRPADAAGVYRRVLAECPDRGQRLATLQKAAGVFAADEYRTLLDEEYARYPGDELGRMRLDARRSAATDAAAAGRFPPALDLMRPVEGLALARRDVDSARLLGWSYEQTGDPESSLDWLRRAADWSGAPTDRMTLAYALSRAGQEEAAAAIAQDLADGDPAARALLRDILVSSASRSAAAGDCRAAIDLLTEAARLGPPPTGELKQLAWALFECERFDESAQVFTDLYVESADDEAARGLVLSDWRRRRLDHSEYVADDHGGPLADRLPDGPLPRRRGDVDYDRLSLTGDGRVEVQIVREWAGLAGVGWSTRQGDGPSRLDAWRAPVLAFEYRRDRHRFALGAERLDLDSGDMGASDFPVNTDRVEGVRITDSESGAWEPAAAWVYEGDLEWRAEIGATPVEGDVSATWQGRLGLARLAAGAGWSLAAVRVPVEESILSWTGARGQVEVDGSPVELPFSWGRVTRNGLDANGYLAVSDDWTLSGDLRMGDYRGHNVESNLGGQFYGLAERRLDGEGDSGLWAGPYLYLSGFEDNRSKFAPGHGGYFSPAWLVGAGLSARWRRGSDDQPWYFEARGSAGYQRHEEDATDLIPDAGLERQVLDTLGLEPGDLGGFGSNSEAGFAGTVELEGLRRIGASDWYVGGFLRGRVSPEFDNAAAMLTFRYGVPQAGHTIRRQFRERFVNMGQ